MERFANEFWAQMAWRVSHERPLWVCSLLALFVCSEQQCITSTSNAEDSTVVTIDCLETITLVTCPRDPEANCTSIVIPKPDSTQTTTSTTTCTTLTVVSFASSTTSSSSTQTSSTSSFTSSSTTETSSSSTSTSSSTTSTTSCGPWSTTPLPANLAWLTGRLSFLAEDTTEQQAAAAVARALEAELRPAALRLSLERDAYGGTTSAPRRQRMTCSYML